MTARVDFANTLRGFAALCVLVSHYLGVFWLSRDVAALVTNGAALPADAVPTPALVFWLNGLELFNWGAYGVALFFIVSGFVIPFSLERMTAPGFCINRLFRILPTYAAGFTVTLLALWVSSRYFGNPWPYSWQEVSIHYIPGLRDILASRNIDYAVWTLEIEVKFYLVCALCIAWFRSGSLKVFLLPALLALSALAAGRWGGRWFAPASLGAHGLAVHGFATLFLVFMFIGVALNYLHRGLLGRLPALAMVGLLFLAFCLLWRTGSAASMSFLPWSYGAAVLTFLLAFFFQKPWQANRISDFFADISYPLYVVHGVGGYVALRLLFEAGAPVLPALLGVTGGACLLAWGLHRLVEEPSLALGRRLLERLRSARARPGPCCQESP